MPIALTLMVTLEINKLEFKIESVIIIGLEKLWRAGINMKGY